MKQKKLTKKLVLNKETIVNIGHPGMKGLIGGLSGKYTCLTEFYPCATYQFSNCELCMTPATGCDRECTIDPCAI